MKRQRVDIGRLLEAVESTSPVAAAEEVAHHLAAAFGATRVSFLVTDVTGRALVRLAHVPADHGRDDEPRTGQVRRDDEESATRIRLDGGPGEQALRSQRVQVVPADPGSADAGSHLVLAPVTERGESIGLLELTLAHEPSEAMVLEIAQVAHVLAFVVIANRQHTDLYEWGQRTEVYSLSAEIQQRLLPRARTCEASAFTLAGWLEPAASVGGDTFDYSLARDVLHLSLTDAMGHGVEAALTASTCLASLRGSRRVGATLVEQAATANTALCEHPVGVGEDFVTGILGRLGLRTGRLDLVNAGHVAPFLVRGDQLRELDLAIDPALGLFADAVYRSTSIQLLAGDRVVLVTDGMLDRNDAHVVVREAILDSRALHPRETVRALADAVLAATTGRLRDDATVLCLDWHGDHEHSREVAFGAEPGRASDPGDVSGS